MKGTNLMKTINAVKLLLLPLLVSLFTLLSCEQPFRAGLGTVVDIRPPTVSLSQPGAGNYIYGKERIFLGTAEDDYKLVSVELMVTNQPMVNYYKEYKLVELELIEQNKGNWYAVMDTTQFPDGDLKIRLKATDSANKIAETDEVVFIIKNELPAITVAAPFIARGREPGDVGGNNLNYATYDTLQPSLSYPRQMDKGSVISGTISYEEDIFTGPVDEAIGRFPPQIRVWSVGDEGYAPNVIPTVEQVPWHTLTSTELFPLSVGSYQFIYPVPDEAGRYYGFEIRAQSKVIRETGIVKFHYPRDYWPDYIGSGDWDDPASSKNPQFFTENRYVLIFVRVPREFPVIDLYKLEDITGKDGWDVDRYKDIEGLSDNVAHPYVDKLTVSKNGPFILRVKTSHANGIQSAEAYWEKDDGSRRGRFIWDPADKPLDIMGWFEGYNVPTDRPYSHWGWRDPHNDATTRNFIFTYNHTADDKVSDANDRTVNAEVRGRSKVQVYTGSKWEERKDGLWSSTPLDDGDWLDIDSASLAEDFPGGILSEGIYNIEIYARSNYGTSSPTPHTNTIRLDWKEPTAEIVSIDGAFNLDLSVDPPVAVVNGVVQPRLRFLDSRMVDSGLRSATDIYHSTLNGAERVYGFDQLFLLVNDDEKMDDAISEGGGALYWPPYPDTTSGNDTTSIQNVTIYKHGPIFESKFLFKSSKIYDVSPVETDALADGDYWLYVFARDNAFNVGHTKLKVQVRKETDAAIIDFMGGAINDKVTNPGPGADIKVIGSSPTDQGGFYYGNLRNRYSGSSTLRMKLKDDDSLDLGKRVDSPADEPDKSKVKITFSGTKHLVGTQPNDAGNVVALGAAESGLTDYEDYLITFDDDEVKAIFAAQSPDGTGRQAVREREGTINQSKLLEKLKDNAKYANMFPGSNPSAYTKNTLPDGIYRLTVTNYDYAPAKLKMPTDPRDPDVAVATTTVWLAVDETDPVLSITAASTEEWLDPTNGLGAGSHGTTLSGTISDRNGPVTVTGFTVTDLLNNPVAGCTANMGEITITRNASPTDPNLWEASYNAPVHIATTVESKIVVTLEVTDRFGRTVSQKREFSIDITPPTVGLSKNMDSFERRDNARMGNSELPPNGTGAANDKFTRLANGVVSFNFNPYDSIKVNAVKWWLLPVGTAFPVFTPTGATSALKMASLLAYNPTGSVKSGTINTTLATPDKLDKMFYINTTSLTDNAEYSLYAIAIDSAGNVSTSTASLQTIYVLQQEDRPWFVENNLQGVVGGSNMTANITINDDDGFSLGTGVRPSTIRITMSSTSAALGNNPTDANITSNGYTAWATIPHTNTTSVPAAGINVGDVAGTVTRMGKNVRLTVDLNKIDIFASVLASSGKKHYVIEATDSWEGKFTDEAGTAATNTAANMVYWRQYYSIELDNEPPRIIITAPADGAQFGPLLPLSLNPPETANNFTVKGSISDSFLKTDSSGNYIIGLRLSGEPLYMVTPPTSGGKPPLILGSEVGIINPGTTNAVEIKYVKTNTRINAADGSDDTSTAATGHTRVDFEIPMATFLTMIGYGGLEDGDVGKNILVFEVEDQSRQSSNVTVKFVKDATAPGYTFTDINSPWTTERQPQELASNWWTTANYETKRATSLPIIAYDRDDSSAVPTLSGTFTDNLSNIDKTSFTIKIDGAAAIPVASTQIEGDGKTVRWTVYLTTDGKPKHAGNTILPDGVHSVTLQIADGAGNVKSDDKLWGFRINSNPPESTITGSSTTVYGDRTGRPSTDTNNVFTIEGTGFSRNLDDVLLTIRYTGGGPAPTKTAHTWHLLKNVASLPANETNVTPTTREWTFTPTGSPTVPVTPFDLRETYAWSLAITRDNIALVTGTTAANGLVNNLLRQGNYEVVVTAVDRTNKRSAETDNTGVNKTGVGGNVWKFTVDTAAPTLSFTNVKSVSAANVDRNPAYWLGYKNDRKVFSDDLSITGSVRDVNNLNAVEARISRWDYNLNTTGGWTHYNFTSETWTENVTDADSWHTVNDFTANADTGYSLDWNFTFQRANSTTATIIGAAAADDGYYRVQLRARDVSIVNTTIPSTGWTATTHDGNPAASDFAYFFVDRNNPTLTAPASFTASTRYLTNFDRTFTPIVAGDANMFESMVVYVERLGNATTGIIPGANANNDATSANAITVANPKQSGTGNWTASQTLRFTPREVINGLGNATNGVPDGSYRIVFEVTDLAGKKSKDASCIITIDNTPPTGSIDQPASSKTSGEYMYGGEGLTIEGKADDTGPDGSASGLSINATAGIWYRVGFGTQDAASLTTLLNMPTTTAAQKTARSVAINQWAIAGGSLGTGRSLGTGVTFDNGSGNNTTFNNASQSVTSGAGTGSLWFKYVKTGTGTSYDVPAYFNDIPEINTLLAWNLSAIATSGGNSVAYNYVTGGVTMRGRTYTGVANDGARDTDNRYLARLVGSDYILPLVIRVVDNNGNVFYELRAIKLKPFDVPTVEVTNPSTDLSHSGVGDNKPRGGQITVSGTARDNVSIKKVIFRVKADNRTTLGKANPNPIPNPIPATGIPTDAMIVNIPDRPAFSWSEVSAITAGKTFTQYNGNTTLAFTQTGWQEASLEEGLWSFMLNAGGEITAAIASRGFNGVTGSTTTNRDMIRIWVEVMAFDGTEGGAYQWISLGDEAVTAHLSPSQNSPRPYVREFFFTSTAPTISEYKISQLGVAPANAAWTTGNFDPYSPSVSNPVYIRSNKFAVKAKLNTPSAHIKDIQVRLVGDTSHTGWTPVYEAGTAPTAVTGLVLATTEAATATNLTGGTATYDTAYLTWSFSSKSAEEAGYRRIRYVDSTNNWNNSGGTFTVEVRVTDDQPQSAFDEYRFEVAVDNFAPIADTAIKVTPRKVAGSDVMFLGRVFDHQGTPAAANPQYKGIQQIEVWFTNSANAFLNMNASGTSTAGTNQIGVWMRPAAVVKYTGDVTKLNDTVDEISGVSWSGAQSSATAPNIISKPSGGANYLKTITKGAGWSGTDSTDMDVSWNFIQNTGYFPNGWIKLHYIVTDKAGNQSYYTQDMVVMNNRPEITEVTLFTDSIGEGAAFADAETTVTYDIPANRGSKDTYPIGKLNYKDGYLNSSFIAKNNFLGFGVKTIQGTAPLYYQIRYVERYLVPLTAANLMAMVNRNGTDTFTRLDNTIVVNAQGNLVNAITGNAPTSTELTNARVTTDKANQFVNLYTIAQDGLTDEQWRLLGVPKLDPQIGDHFVFQGTYTANPATGAPGNLTWTTPAGITAIQNAYAENNVRNMNFSNEYVYAYKEIIGTVPAVKREGNEANTMPLNTGTGGKPELLFERAATAIPSGHFNDNFTTANKINEAQAKNASNAVNPNSSNETTIDTASQGTAFFLLKVWDTADNNETAPTGISALDREKDMLYDALVIGMKVFVGDRRDPYARLYDLNPYMETAVSSNNADGTALQETLDAALAPRGIGANIKRGGLYNIGKESAPVKSGYIDPRGNSTALQPYVNYPNDPLLPYAGGSTIRRENSTGFLTGDSAGTTAIKDKVSGKIILRGLAWDDQLVGKIEIVINGTATTILQWDSVSKTMKAPAGVNAWPVERIHWQTGHTVEWAYLWDTEKLPNTDSRADHRGGPLTNVSVAVVVTDAKGSPAPRPNKKFTVTGDGKVGDYPTTSTDPETVNNETNFHNTILVDIVPYVTGFRRAERFATNRSRQGWYSFYRGETGIRVLGYNLGSSGSTTIVYLNSAGTTANGDALTANRSYTANTNIPNNGHIFAIPDATTSSSGKITLTVGSTTNNGAWNHSSIHTNKSWNKENSVTGADLWINKPYAHIWRSTQDLTAPATIFGNNTADGGSINADSPSMGLEYNTGTATTNQGRLHGTWGIRSNFGVYYGTNGNAARTTLQTANDPLLLTDFDYFPSNTNLNRNRTMVSVYEWDGRPQVFINTTMTNAGNETGEISATNGALTAAASATNTDSTDRWTNPRVRMTAAHTSDTRGNTGRLYSSMYDTMTKSLYFVYRSGTNNTGGYIDGESSTGTAATGSLAASARAGMWSAVDYIDAGGTNPTRPVIAYYDEANDTLRLAYCSLYNSATIGNWTRRNVLDASSPLLRGSGKYVSMKIVGDNIHLAFYNSTYNTMVYAVGTTTGTFTAVTVDNVVKGGVWTDIAVDSSGNPWITYGDLGRIGGNYDGVRVAYKTTATPANGGFTQANRALTDKVTNTSITGWEAVTMPANYIISDDRLNIEAWPPANRPGVTGTVSGTGGGWAAAVGYLGTDTDSVRQFRIGYFFKPDNAVVNAFQTVGN